MKVEITVKKSYNVLFCVKQYTETESGMHVDYYAHELPTLDEAIILLEEAIIREEGGHHNWQIVVDVV